MATAVTSDTQVPDSAGEPILAVRDLYTYFATPRGVLRAVDGVSFDLFSGEAFGIVGESGCGKSVTCRSLIGLLPIPPASTVGTVMYEGRNLVKLSRSAMQKVRGAHISMIFQDPMSSLNPVMRVGDQIEEALQAHTSLRHADRRRAVIELLQRVRIPMAEQRIDDYPHQFSGGMRQRVLIAIALASKPRILLADIAKFSLKLFEDVVLKNSEYLKLITGDVYVHKTYNMGTVDANNCTNFYDGKIRITGPDGKEFAKYDAANYRDHIAERVEPWSYLKFPYLKKVGWKGFVDGVDSGVYKATPLSRLNAADGMATPLANAEYKRFYETLGGKPVHHTLATHWARLVELLYAAERWVQLATDPQITSKEYRVLPTETPHEGVGCVEAPRGTLTHHYVTDERGILTKVNLVVGTTNNNAPICMSVKKAAQGLIHKGQVTEGLLNMVEMAFRAYDPCFGCATHSLPGQMPLEVTVRDPDGDVVQRLSQYVE